MPFKDPVRAKEYDATRRRDPAFKAAARARAAAWNAEHHGYSKRRWASMSVEAKAELRAANAVATRKYRSTDKGRIVHCLVQSRRRARKAMNVAGLVTRDQWLVQLEVFGHRCAYCLQSGSMTQDHVIPIAAGGPHSIDNLVPACRQCNLRKHARGPLATLRAW